MNEFSKTQPCFNCYLCWRLKNAGNVTYCFIGEALTFATGKLLEHTHTQSYSVYSIHIHIYIYVHMYMCIHIYLLYCMIYNSYHIYYLCRYSLYCHFTVGEIWKIVKMHFSSFFHYFILIFIFVFYFLLNTIEEFCIVSVVKCICMHLCKLKRSSKYLHFVYLYFCIFVIYNIALKGH